MGLGNVAPAPVMFCAETDAAATANKPAAISFAFKVPPQECVCLKCLRTLLREGYIPIKTTTKGRYAPSSSHGVKRLRQRKKEGPPGSQFALRADRPPLRLPHVGGNREAKSRPPDSR